jgi:hypothetical protein
MKLTYFLTSCITNQARDFAGRSNMGTNQPTNQQTDGPTNGVCYRGACSRLKMEIGCRCIGCWERLFGLNTLFLVESVNY